ncbi:MAG TPA: hypothetical protein VJT13_09435 [Xanthobacteraceae bacterium]|nr:hypothetical protein [Xanthobacteraceae bacterium]
MTALRRTQLIRFGAWTGLATLAVLVAVIAARTEAGVRRIATLVSPEPPAAARSAKELQSANRALDQEAEQRRLSEAIRMLAADRDRLLARIGTLERSVEDVTGSIAKAPPAAPSAPAMVQAAPEPAAPAQSRVAAGHLATGSPAAVESVATKTEFGVDLGTNTTIEGLRALWARLKANQPGLLEGLRPVMALREGPRGAAPELRLIAGPLANASVAARLCAALAAGGQACQPAVFDGQRLALQ